RPGHFPPLHRTVTDDDKLIQRRGIIFQSDGKTGLIVHLYPLGLIANKRYNENRTLRYIQGESPFGVGSRTNRGPFHQYRGPRNGIAIGIDHLSLNDRQHPNEVVRWSVKSPPEIHIQGGFAV